MCCHIDDGPKIRLLGTSACRGAALREQTNWIHLMMRGQCVAVFKASGYCFGLLPLSCLLGSASGSMSSKSEREARGNAAAPAAEDEPGKRGDEPRLGCMCSAPARLLAALERVDLEDSVGSRVLVASCTLWEEREGELLGFKAGDCDLLAFDVMEGAAREVMAGDWNLVFFS